MRRVETIARTALRIGATAAVAIVGIAHAASAQQPRNSAVTLVLDVGSAEENQLRYLQTIGAVPLSQWTIRGFGPREITKLVVEDSTGVLSFVPATTVQRWGALEWQRSEIVGTSWYNSDFAFGYNDGAVWRGRGTTLALRGGIAARYGPLTVQLQPLVFAAQNRAFGLMPHGATGVSEFADPISPGTIDRPQRFGNRLYARLDPGQSTIRLDGWGATVGFSTANQWWGPMSEWPYVLSNNAAGFPHLFLGSTEPLKVWIGEIHGRIIYGRLEQSDYAVVTGGATSQFTTGVIASFRPRGVEGLEIGAARLFEISWPREGLGWQELRKPFENFLKASVRGDSGATANSSADNQLASVFGRWVFPATGAEIYAELGREDHSWDTRDFLLEPDHSMTVGVGFRKAWRERSGVLSAITTELFDLDPSHLGRHRWQGGKYAHTKGATQGHTNRGQILGAGFAAFNGSGTRLAWDRYKPTGEKLSVSVMRMGVRQRPRATHPGDPVDVQYVLAADRTIRLRDARLKYGLTGVYELNRYLADDATNLQATLELSW